MNKLIIISIVMFGVLFARHSFSADKFQIGISEESNNALEHARYIRSKEGQKATIPLLLSIIEESPNYYRAHYNLGMSYYHNGESSKAIESLKYAEEIRRSDDSISEASLFNTMGYVYLRNLNNSEAEHYFLKAIDEKKNLKYSTKRKVYNNIGTLYIGTGEYDKAEKYLSIARDKYSSKLAAKNIELVKTLKEKALLINME